MDNDRSWMLNPNAICAARKCIQITQIELGISLKLTHPQFVEMLGEYADLTDSKELREAVVELMTYYNRRNAPQTGKTLEKKHNPTDIVIGEQSIKKYIREAGDPNYAPQNQVYQAASGDSIPPNMPSHEDMTVYGGKEYPTYNKEGKKFKGLYRGQPHYS